MTSIIYGINDKDKQMSIDELRERCKARIKAGPVLKHSIKLYKSDEIDPETKRLLNESDGMIIIINPPDKVNKEN